MKFSIKDQWAKWVLSLASSALPDFIEKAAYSQADFRKRDALLAARAALVGALEKLENL